MGNVLAVSPSVTFSKYILGQQISTTISDSRNFKALLVLLCKLECFAVCWGYKFCLAIIYKLKGGKGVNILEI